MNKQNSSHAQVGIGRRQLLKLAGASAAVTGTSVSTGRAFAGDADKTGDILDVVIIGGGLAGLTAARDLKRAGCESFMVLEARDRVGGRTLNHDLGNGYFSEAGGQWIGPGQTAIADLARELGVGTFPTYYQGEYVLLANGVRATVESDGTMSTDPKLRHELEEMARTVPTAAPWTAPRAAEFDAMSYGDWLASKNLSPEEQLNFSLPAQATTGVSPSRLSLLHYLSLINSADNRHERLEGIKGGAQESRISGGSQILSIKMAEALGDRVRLSSPVSRIENWKDGPVAMHTPKGVFRARSVIVALSPSLCHQIAFEPQLPEKRREMQRRFPAYAPMRKTAHVYKKAFWRDKGLSGLMTQLNGPIQWAYDNSPEDVSFGVISAFINNGALPSDPKLAEAELSQIYAQALGEEALHPIAFYDHDWGKVDRWSLSCTSPIPPGFLTQYGDVLKPPIGQLIWAGTETADIWITTMDGAIRSGHKAALQALQAVATKRTA